MAFATAGVRTASRAPGMARKDYATTRWDYPELLPVTGHPAVSLGKTESGEDAWKGAGYA